MTKKRLIRSTTVLSVRRDGKVVLAGDGQVTLGESVIKHSAKKIRRMSRHSQKREGDWSVLLYPAPARRLQNRPSARQVTNRQNGMSLHLS